MAWFRLIYAPHLELGSQYAQWIELVLSMLNCSIRIEPNFGSWAQISPIGGVEHRYPDCLNWAPSCSMAEFKLNSMNWGCFYAQLLKSCFTTCSMAYLGWIILNCLDCVELLNLCLSMLYSCPMAQIEPVTWSCLMVQFRLIFAQWPELALLYAELLNLGLFILNCLNPAELLNLGTSMFNCSFQAYPCPTAWISLIMLNTSIWGHLCSITWIGLTLWHMLNCST